ncbi:MAG: agmatinase [Sphingobacteriales bacterium]|nr:agmatinase [Sphingobacteriales bacterium]
MLKVLGIPFDKNSSFLQGPALAPPLIRKMDTDGSANRFAENGMSIAVNENYMDEGDLNLQSFSSAEAFNSIKSSVAHHIQNGDKLICLGGDHSVSYPIIAAHADAYQPIHILHLDAHADLYENFEDNPYSHASPFARLMETGNIASLTQVGIRTLNTHQREQAAKYGVRIIEMKDFSTNFIQTLSSPLYISLDLDVLDPAYAPGISHHEPGGLTARELISIIQAIRVPIIGADIVEYNPTRDINNMTAMVAYKLFKEMAAKMLTTSL